MRKVLPSGESLRVFVRLLCWEKPQVCKIPTVTFIERASGHVTHWSCDKLFPGVACAGIFCKGLCDFRCSLWFLEPMVNADWISFASGGAAACGSL